VTGERPFGHLRQPRADVGNHARIVRRSFGQDGTLPQVGSVVVRIEERGVLVLGDAGHPVGPTHPSLFTSQPIAASKKVVMRMLVSESAVARSAEH
jgi:hypothetical protein